MVQSAEPPPLQPASPLFIQVSSSARRPPRGPGAADRAGNARPTAKKPRGRSPADTILRHQIALGAIAAGEAVCDDPDVHSFSATLVLAAHATTIDRLRHVPTQVWLNVAIMLVAIYVVYRFWRTLKSINDYAPYLAGVVVASAVFFYWVYTRTEPRFLTPVVERLAPFFPTKARQEETVDRARASRES